MGWLTLEVPIDHQLFGKAFPCPVCDVGRQSLLMRANVPHSFRTAQDNVCRWQLTEAQKTARTILGIMADDPTGLLTASGTHGVLLCGPTGTGKTTLAVDCLLASRWARDACYIDWSDLIARIKGSWGSDDDSEEAALRRPMECQFLILDDLGAGGEIDTRLAISVAERIAKARTDRDDLWTIVTTNLTPGQIAEHLGARVASRLTNRLACVPVTGPDQRAADKE